MSESNMAAQPSQSHHPAEIVFLRHAESLANITEMEIDHGLLATYPSTISSVRDADVELTERGVKQARVTGHYLTATFGPFDYCYVSPWTRTRQTLDHVLEAYAPEQRQEMRRHLRYDERLREREMGVLNWLTREEIAERYPDQARRREIDGEYYYRPSGGESWADVAMRVDAFLTALYRDRPGCRVLVVAHSVVIHCMRKVLERLDEREILRVESLDGARNCSINQFVYDPRAGEQGRLVLRQWNVVAYGPELASVVPDERQRQPRPGE